MPTRRELANAIRALSMDAVQAANSGHPGMPMGMADIAQVLWNDFLSHSPNNPEWVDRDRFVLSNGHGSMLLYSVLHLSGYPLSLDEIRNFRQLGFKTAGHPEYEIDIGVETTTGPLGQGIANAVGMALAEKALGQTFNRPKHSIVDHYTYVFTGDGCLMEGISHEVCSLAGTHRLGKLICFYDDNGISIDGPVEGWFTDDTPGRFEAYGWQVIRDVDGHDPGAVGKAIVEARECEDQPTLICCKTVIGWGAPNKQGTASTHGAPLGDDEIAQTRANIGWEHEAFVIPDDIRGAWDARQAGEACEAEWKERFAAYRAEHPELAAEFLRRTSGELPEGWAQQAEQAIAAVAKNGGDVATRKASEMALNAFGPHLPELLGGSADLTGSNNTYWDQSKPISSDDAAGNYLYFGVREFGMSAFLNGVALHGGFIPYGATFLTFSDYARNAVRMAALMGLRNLFVYTHDSIGLGEDGPTHQPVEHLASLRIIPNMVVWRPCDVVESLVAWRSAIERRDGPTSLVFTRQSVPHQARDAEQIENIKRGAYVLQGAEEIQPDIILIATGSEVGLAMEAAATLQQGGVKTRVVSMPSSNMFDAQDAVYRESVLPQAVPKVAVEAGVTQFWRAYVGPAGRVVGVDSFGASAPAKQLYKHFGVTAENVVAAAQEILQA